MRRFDPLIIGVVAVMIVLVAIAVVNSQDRPAAGSGGATAGDVLVRPDSPTRGAPAAPVTLVEFLDPECEACRAFHPIVEETLGEYGDKVRLVVRYVRGHANSALAIIALEAARKQSEDKYWEMLSLLYERQSEWGEREEPQAQAFLDAAVAVGLDAAPIKAAMEAGDMTMVERDFSDARAAGIDGTPSFFVNGAMLSEPTPETLRAAIDAALDG